MGERERKWYSVCFTVSLSKFRPSCVCMYFDGMGPCVEVGVGPT